MGKPGFEAVHEMDDDPDFYKLALGITRSILSEETLRQRMDDIGDTLRQQILQENIRILAANQIRPTKLPNGFVPVDIDVTSMDNSKTKKEGVSRTYKVAMAMLSSWDLEKATYGDIFLQIYSIDLLL